MALSIALEVKSIVLGRRRNRGSCSQTLGSSFWPFRLPRRKRDRHEREGQALAALKGSKRGRLIGADIMIGFVVVGSSPSRPLPAI